MRLDYIDPFVNSSYNLLKEVLGGEIKKEDLILRENSMPILGVAIMIAVTGNVNGRVVLDMDKQTALKICSAMNGESFEEFNDFAQSTIMELGNMVTGKAITALSELGFQFQMSAPTIFTGTDMHISIPKIEAVVVPLITAQGKIHINIAIKEEDKA